MQCKNITKWFAVFLIVPLVFALIPARTVQADSLNIRYENGILSWDAVSNAAKYTVYAIDTSDKYQNFTRTITATSFNLRDAMNKDKDCPSGKYRIEVAAFRSNGLEILRNKITIEYTAVMPRLDSPTPRFNGKTLEWDPVENADQYRVEIQVGASKTSWYTLDKGINKTVTGTSLVIDDDFIESDLYYQARVRAVSNSNYIWSVDGASEIVTGEQLLNGYASPVVFTGTITLNISDPKAGDKLHATLSGVPSSIPSSKITYTWAIQERIGIGAYTMPKTIQESASPDFVVPDNAATVTVFVNASGYDGFIRNDYRVTIKGWYKISDGSMFYYVDNNPVTGWKEIGIVSSGHRYWFYFDSNGVMQTGWVQSSGTWYYLDSEGRMLKEWQQIDGEWYYLGGNGAMRTNWQQIGGVWYYLGSNGVMRTGWQQIGGVSYYFKSSGAMAANEYCGGYWLSASGAWTYKHKASWKKDSTGWWFGDDTGWYAKDESLTIDGKVYNFNASGYCTNP